MTSETLSKRSSLLKAIGPWILYAGAAIGGSHLVHSTRAGAMYGFSLLWIVILVNLFKYPFFEFVHRYTAAKDETILDGYDRVGRWMLVVFTLIAALSAILNIAGVTVVTAGLGIQVLPNLFGEGIAMFAWSAIVLFVCVALLMVGHYPLLDSAIKIIVALLAVATLAAFALALAHGPAGETPTGGTVYGTVFDFIPEGLSFAFLLTLMGWMPTPIDVGVWPSLWTQERIKQTGHRPTLRESTTDFLWGYLTTCVLAVAFLGLGALVMYGTGETFSSSGITFCGQLIELYSRTLGAWSYVLVALAAFTCMFSTTLTCVDAYPRVLHACYEILRGRRGESYRDDKVYWGVMLVCCGATLVIVRFFMSNMLALLTVAAIIAFLTAPVVAFFNYRVVTRVELPPQARPSKSLLILSWAGLLFLTALALIFLYYQFLAG